MTISKVGKSYLVVHNEFRMYMLNDLAVMWHLKYQLKFTPLQITSTMQLLATHHHIKLSA